MKMYEDGTIEGTPSEIREFKGLTTEKPEVNIFMAKVKEKPKKGSYGLLYEEPVVKRKYVKHVKVGKGYGFLKAQRKQIKKAFLSGVSVKKLARLYGSSESAIYHWLNKMGLKFKNGKSVSQRGKKSAWTAFKKPLLKKYMLEGMEFTAAVARISKEYWERGGRDGVQARD